MALEMNSPKRELCSRLIADMYGRVIEPQYMEDAFVALLKQVFLIFLYCSVVSRKNEKRKKPPLLLRLNTSLC